MVSAQEHDILTHAVYSLRQQMEQGVSIHSDYSNEDLSGLYEAAYAYYASNEFEKAALLFKQLIQRKPLTQSYWMGLAACTQLQTRYEEALESWGMAAILNDEDPTPHLHAAECYQALNEPLDMQKALNATRSRLRQGSHQLHERLDQLESFFKCNTEDN